MITNIVFESEEGVFDFNAEGAEFEIVEVFEDGISFYDHNDEFQVFECIFVNGRAVVYGM